MKVNKKITAVLSVYNHLANCAEFLDEINTGYKTFPELQDDDELEEEVVEALGDMREMCEYIMELTS